MCILYSIHTCIHHQHNHHHHHLSWTRLGRVVLNISHTDYVRKNLLTRPYMYIFVFRSFFGIYFVAIVVVCCCVFISSSSKGSYTQPLAHTHLYRKLRGIAKSSRSLSFTWNIFFLHVWRCALYTPFSLTRSLPSSCNHFFFFFIFFDNH